MHVKRWLKTIAAVLVATCGLAAGDFDDVLKAVKLAWPEKTTAAAICSIDFNQLALLDLTDAAKAQGISIIILNVKTAKDLDKTLSNLFSRNPEFMILIEDDPVLGLKSEMYTKRIISRAQSRHIPTVSLSEAALKEGAMLVAGPNTNGKVLVNGPLALKMGYSLPADFQIVEVK